MVNAVVPAIRRGSLALALTVTVMMPPAGAAAEPVGQAAGCPPAWQVVASPEGSEQDNGLADVAVVADDDVWAVGYRLAGDVRSTLIEHWDGVRWRIVPSPNGALPVNWLTGVSAAAPDDVWAVGFTNDGNGFQARSDSLVLHWDGLRWGVVPSPNPIPDPNPGDYPVSNELYDVHALAPDDVWAVGHTLTLNVEQTLALHWNGSSWSTVPTPHDSRYSRLRAVDAAAPGDVWAVGEIDRLGTQRTLTQHFDGTAWSTVASPSAGPAVDYMTDVTVIAPDDVWAVGYHIDVIGVTQPYQTMSWHFDGQRWRLIPSRNVTTLNNYLFAATAVPGRGLLAVGFWDTGFELRSLSEVWLGGTWRVAPSPSPGIVYDELTGIDAGDSAVWAVGQTGGGFAFRTLTMRLPTRC